MSDDNTEDLEREARSMGWAPREQWRGRQEDFVEADKFVERGRKIVPILNSQFDKERAERKRLETELASTKDDFERRIKASETMAEKALKAQRAAMMSDFERQKREAASAGDTTAYDRVARQESDAYRRMADEDKSAAPPAAPATPQTPREVQEFADRNPWFFGNEALRKEAIELHDRYTRESPHLSMADNLAAVEREVKRRHAASFGLLQPDDRQSQAQTVEGVSSARAGQARKKARGYNDMPREAKAACDRMIEQGYLKGDKVKEIYAAEYFESYGE